MKKTITEKQQDQKLLIEGLLEESKNLVNSDLHQALLSARRALQHSESYGSKYLLGFSHGRLSEALMKLGELEEGELHAHESLAIAKAINDPILHCLALHCLSRVKVKFADFHGTIDILSEEIRHAQLIQDEDVKRKIIIYATLGLAMPNQDLGQGEKAFELLSNALEMTKESSDPIDSAYVLFSLGYLAHHCEDYLGAEDYTKQALLIAEIEDNKYLLFSIFNRLSDLCGPDRAAEKLAFAEKALVYAQANNNSHQIANALYTKGEGYKFLSRFEEAIQCFLNAIEIYDTLSHSTSTHIGLYVELAEIYLKVGNKEQANLALQKIEKWEEHFLEIPSIRLKQQLAFIYSLKGDFEQAYHYLASSYEIKNRQFTSKMKANIDNHRTALKIVQDKHENEIRKLRYDTLEQQVSLQAKQLVTQTEVLAKFRDDLREIVRKSNNSDSTIREVKEKLKELPCKSIDWEKFESEFGAVHPEFAKKLNEHYPYLTAMETKMCTLLRLNLKSHEIARLFCVTERAVEFHRLNIRKKFEIPKDQSLSVFLNAL